MRRKIIVRGPALSNSGYGVQTRFALEALKSHQDKFDIFLIVTGWGRTGWLIEDNDERKWIDDLVQKTQFYFQQHNSNPPPFDLSLQVTIPGEFEQIANFNVGYTAGIESTKAPPEWIQKSNLMNKIITTSNHTKDTLLSTTYRVKVDNNNDMDLRVMVPTEAVSYSIRNYEPKQIPLNLESSFNFLSVAQWGPRKNVEATISSFINEFLNDEDVGLILKMNTTKNCLMDKEYTEVKLTNFIDSVVSGRKRKCKIYFLHGNMTDEEMAGLYSNPKIKALVTTTHGEGFGLPIFEAVCNGLPVIAPAWSGHLDFLFAPKRDKETGKIKMKPFFTKIDYDIAQVQKDAIVPGIIQEDSKWCFVKNYSVRSAMREVFKNHATAVSQANKLKEYVLQTFGVDEQNNKFVNAIIDQLPKAMFENDTFSKIESELKERNILDDIIGL